MITPADAAELLTVAAAFDRRTIGKTDALAWADALSDLEPVDCAEAIRAHFRDSTEYLMPAHVRQGVRRLRADRIRSAPSNLLESPDVDPNDVPAYLAAGRARRAMIGDGQTLADDPGLATWPVEALAEATLARLPRMPKVQLDLGRLAPKDAR